MHTSIIFNCLNESSFEPLRSKFSRQSCIFRVLSIHPSTKTQWQRLLWWMFLASHLFIFPFSYGILKFSVTTQWLCWALKGLISHRHIIRIIESKCKSSLLVKFHNDQYRFQQKIEMYSRMWARTMWILLPSKLGRKKILWKSLFKSFFCWEFCWIWMFFLINFEFPFYVFEGYDWNERKFPLIFSNDCIKL